MKGYLKYFRVYFIIILVLTVIFAVLKLTGAGKQPAERGNTEAVTQERVFDYADKLTDEEYQDQIAFSICTALMNCLADQS